MARSIQLVLLVAGVAAITAGCQSAGPQESAHLREAITGHLTQHESIDLASLVPTGWSSMVIVPPYSDLNRKGRDLDFRVPKAARKASIEYRDDICLLFLLDGASVQEWTAMPRQLADFTSAGAGRRIAAKQANFALKADESGWQFMVSNNDGSSEIAESASRQEAEQPATHH